MKFQEVAPGVFVDAAETGRVTPGLVKFLTELVARDNGAYPIYLAWPGDATIMTYRPWPDREVRILEVKESWSVVDPETGQNEAMEHVWKHPDTGEWKFED